MTSHLVIAPEVADALATGAAVVALESTILAHGLPRGDNRRDEQGGGQAQRRCSGDQQSALTCAKRFSDAPVGCSIDWHAC